METLLLPISELDSSGSQSYSLMPQQHMHAEYTYTGTNAAKIQTTSSIAIHMPSWGEAGLFLFAQPSQLLHTFCLHKLIAGEPAATNTQLQLA